MGDDDALDRGTVGGAGNGGWRGIREAEEILNEGVCDTFAKAKEGDTEGVELRNVDDPGVDAG